MDATKLKTELGRIRGAIMSGSFDRDTALNALDECEKEVGVLAASKSTARPLSESFSERPQPHNVPPASAANPVPEQVGKPFVSGGTVTSGPVSSPARRPPLSAEPVGGVPLPHTPGT